MAQAGFPSAVWDGDSQNRNSDNAPQMAPDWRDWDRMIAEIAAVQQSNQGFDPDNVLNSYGTLTSLTGLAAVERGNAALHKTILTFTDMSVASTDGSTPATDAAWGSQLLYTFPQGHVCILGTHVVFPLGKIAAVTGGGGGFADAANIDVGIGTTARANASNFALNTVGTDYDIIGSVLDIDLTSKTSDAIESGSLIGATNAPIGFDGSTTAAKMYLNFCTQADGDHGVTADALLFGGTFTFLWTMLGDD